MKPQRYDLKHLSSRVISKVIVVIWGCLGIAQAGFAQTVQTAQISQFKLANGLTVIVQPDKRAPTAVHMLWMRVGSMDEVDGTSGVAHVLEHMMLKGTPTVKAGEFSRQVAALGGRENAVTSKDYIRLFPTNPVQPLGRRDAPGGRPLWQQPVGRR